METIAEIARRIVQEELAAYCTDELGWGIDKLNSTAYQPSIWIQRAVERALRECPACSRPDPLGEALNSGDGSYRP